jgi:hypothetical protein
MIVTALTNKLTAVTTTNRQKLAPINDQAACRNIRPLGKLGCVTVVAGKGVPISPSGVKFSIRNYYTTRFLFTSASHRVQ